jgi:hypothetical protein
MFLGPLHQNNCAGLSNVLVLHFGGRKDNSLALEDLVTLVGIIGLGRTSSDMTT